MVQAALVVDDKHTGSSVLRMYKGQSPSLWYTAFVPLPVEALAAIGRALSNRGRTQETHGETCHQ